MAKKNSDDMAGSVSEPRGSAPEVKPAKSLWPKPYQEVRIEPSLEPVQSEDAPVVVPPVAPPDGDFDTVPPEGYQERIEPELPAVLHESAPGEPVSQDEPSEDPSFEEAAEAPPQEPIPIVPRMVPEPEPEFAPEPAAEIVPENEPEPLRVREDERTAAMFDAADHQKPPLDEPRESRTGRFVAMAAGIVVALALGSVAFVYGASGLGIKFGGEDTDTAQAAAPPPAPEPVPVETATDEELKAAQQRVAELEARLKELEEQNAAATTQPEEPASSAGQTAAIDPSDTAPAPDSAAAAPETPARSEPPAEPPAAAAKKPEPVPEPKPAPQETARASEPKPDPAPAARSEPETPRPVELGAPPRPLAPPPQQARIEREPPPRYDPQPSYDRPRGTPEMPVLQGWAVRDVYNGIAVVQGRGAPMEVEPGDDLPGGNRVLAIRRLGGSWAVITERGIISGD